MEIRIVTDSGADLPVDLAKELNIEVVPLRILFGDKDYRDEIDLDIGELYEKLEKGSVHPTTSTPSPGEFAKAYSKLIKEGVGGIISIHLSSKLSKTYGSALQARELLTEEEKKACKIEVIDSAAVSMGMGLLAIEAAKMAKNGDKFDAVVEAVKTNIDKLHLIGILDTLKYLVRGGRAPRAAIVADYLKIKTVIRLKEGELHLAGAVKTQRGKTDKLIGFMNHFSGRGFESMAVEYSSNLEEAEEIKKTAESLFPETKIYLNRLGAALGVHGGPGTIILGIMTKS